MIASPAPPRIPSRTAQSLLESARDRLSRVGADAPWLTALALIEAATGLSRVTVLAHPERQLSVAETVTFEQLIERRCEREPLAYILGRREFYGRDFRVTSATLIPRPETEELIPIALEVLDRVSAGTAPRVLDVGTGCGALAVTLASLRRNARVTATDRSLDALAVAQANADACGVAERVRFVACDLAEAVQGPFTVLVANLPYVPRSEIDTLEPEVRIFEPRLALDGGADGTDLILRLLQDLPRLVTSVGCAAFELGDGQAAVLTARAHDVLPDWTVSVRPDATGRDRFLVLERSS